MNDLIEKLRGFQSRLLLAIHGLDEEALRRPEGEGKWSIANVIAHLGDVELLYAMRLRSAIAGDANWPSLDQDKWIGQVHAGRESSGELLENFWFVRRMNATLLERVALLTPEVNQLAHRLVAHGEKHFLQIERIKKTLGLVAMDDANLRNVVAGKELSVNEVGPGLRVRELWRSGEKRALEVEFAPGAQWPGLDHHVPGPEEVYVLAGDFDDGANVHRAGTFLHHPAGTSHSPRSEEGCRLFVFYPEG